MIAPLGPYAGVGETNTAGIAPPLRPATSCGAPEIGMGAETQASAAPTVLDDPRWSGRRLTALVEAFEPFGEWKPAPALTGREP